MSYEAELAQAHMERRRRLWGAGDKPAPVIKPEPEPEPEPPEVVRDWLYVSGGITHSDRIKREVAKKHGITLAQLTSHKRLKEYVCARRELFYRLKTEIPSLSLGQIGRLGGGFDHTTVLWGIARYKELGPVKYTPSDNTLAMRKGLE